MCGRRRGERVIIPERGKEIAALVPLGAEREGVLLLASRGKLTWFEGRPAGWGRGTRQPPERDRA